MPVSEQSDRRSYKFAITILVFIAILYAGIPRNADLRAFDPARMAARETAMWRDYYEKHYVKLFIDLYRASRREFRFSPLDSFRIALAGAHAARLFQPTRTREEAEIAMPPLEVYYSLLRKGSPASFDPEKAARLELDWWQARREQNQPQDYGRTIAATASMIYGSQNPDIEQSGILRAEAMAYRDARNGRMTRDDWSAVAGQLSMAYGKLKQGIDAK